MRTGPVVGAMVLPLVPIICFEVVQNNSIAYLVGLSPTTVKLYATIHKTQHVLYISYTVIGHWDIHVNI